MTLTIGSKLITDKTATSQAGNRTQGPVAILPGQVMGSGFFAVDANQLVHKAYAWVKHLAQPALAYVAAEVADQVVLEVGGNAQRGA